MLTRTVEPGQIVGAGLAALCSASPRRPDGDAGAAARVRPRPRSAPACRRTVTPVGSTQTYQGSIWQVSPIIDPQTRQGVARIAVPYDRDLRPGGFATAEIRAGSVDAPLLPESAVQSDNQGSYVYIVDARTRSSAAPVKVGEVSDRGVVDRRGPERHRAGRALGRRLPQPGREGPAAAGRRRR